MDKNWIGKEVIPVGAFDVKRYGTLGEEAVVPANILIEKPKNLSFVESTAIWVPFITAYGAINGNFKKGDTVLITAASSVVALAAVDIIKKEGGIPIGITRSESKIKELNDLGIEKVAVSSSPNFIEDVLRLTDEKGVDIVFDSIGGNFLETAAKVCAKGGETIEYGVLGGLEAKFPVVEVIGKGLTVRGYTMGEVLRNKEKFDKVTKYILDGLKNEQFKPRIAKIFELDDYKKAFDELVNGQEIGRIVVKM